MKYVVSTLTALLLLILQNWAHAEPITSAYSTGIFYRDCETTTCDDISQVPTAGIVDINPVSGSELINQSFGDLGTASALVIQGPEAFSPTLKTEVISGEDALISSQAIALQRYENTGSSVEQVQLALDFDSTITDYVAPADNSFFTHGNIIQARVFKQNSGTVDLTYDINGFFTLGNLFNDTGSKVDELLYEDAAFHVTNGSTTINLNSDLFSLDPGETFFVALRLLSIARDGMIADAFDTLTTSLLDENGVAYAAGGPLRASVPEPGTLGLLGLGLIGLLTTRRKNQAVV